MLGTNQSLRERWAATRKELGLERKLEESSLDDKEKKLQENGWIQKGAEGDARQGAQEVSRPLLG